MKAAGALADEIGIKDLATGVAEDAKHVVEGKLDTQKGRIAEGLGGVAHALREVSKRGVRGAPEAELSPALAPYIARAADEVDRASTYFDDKSIGEVARDIEGFARREPALFLGGAFALGVIGGRFLKASQHGSAEGQGGGSSANERGRSPQDGKGTKRADRGLPGATLGGAGNDQRGGEQKEARGGDRTGASPPSPEQERSSPSKGAGAVAGAAKNDAGRAGAPPGSPMSAGSSATGKDDHRGRSDVPGAAPPDGAAVRDRGARADASTKKGP